MSNLRALITGSHDIPLSSEALLDAELEVLLKVANTIDDVFERAVYTHLNLAYLQYFLDGNKRTARLMQTAVLADQGIMPLLLRVEDIIPYQTSVLEYFETGNYSSYALSSDTRVNPTNDTRTDPFFVIKNNVLHVI